jgi:hypothetical protein
MCRMKNIYAKARGVFVWLGPRESDCKATMEAIRNDFMKVYVQMDRSEELTKVPITTIHLLERSWWSRFWAIQ